MNFELNEDDVALVDAISSVCRAKFPIDVVRSMQGGLRRDLWEELATTGVFNIRLPESDGGAGLGFTQSVLIFEELGKWLVPGPLIATHLAAGTIDGADDGSRIVGYIDIEDSPIVVEHFGAVDMLIGGGADSMVCIDPGQMKAELLGNPFDPQTPVWTAQELPQGIKVYDADQTELFKLRAACLSAAFLLGIAGRCVESAVEYSLQRKQFDRPIGSFQAVKHLLADALTRTEVCRASVYAAGVTLDDPSVGNVSRAALGAKLLASDAAIANARTSIQVHGGMGFTWEVDAHLYLKRAIVMATGFSTPEQCALSLADFLA